MEYTWKLKRERERARAEMNVRMALNKKNAECMSI